MGLGTGRDVVIGFSSSSATIMMSRFGTANFARQGFPSVQFDDLWHDMQKTT